jgi:hypothetical protein
MQLISVYLYPNKIDVFTNSIAEWTTERYRQVYQRNLKIYRGVDNRIDIHVKTSDQKPQNITGYSFILALIERETQELLLQKECDARSLSLGKISATITADDLLDINPGSYQYSVIKETRSNVDSTEYTVTAREVLYLDSQYGTQGTIEVYGNVYGEPKPSLVIREFREDVSYEADVATVFYSSIIDARPQLTTEETVHTFRFYMTDYDGEVVIQGSQSEGANPQVWTDIATYEVVGSDLAYTTVTGKYNWLRVKHTPGKVTSVAEFVVAQTILNEYTVSIRNPGSGYQVGDTITISGARLGGETPGQNLVITVDTVSDSGQIETISWTGNSYSGVRTFVLSGDTASSGTIDKILYR